MTPISSKTITFIFATMSIMSIMSIMTISYADTPTIPSVIIRTPTLPLRPVVINPLLLLDINKCKNDKTYYNSNNKTSSGGKNQCAELFKSEQEQMVKDGQLKPKLGFKPNAYLESTYETGNLTIPTFSSQKAENILRKPLGPDTYKGIVKKQKIILSGGRINYSPTILPHTTRGTSVSGFIGIPVGMNIAAAANFNNNLFGLSRTTTIDPSLFIHMGWESNGTTVASCHEYAYERNYEYNNLDKQALSKEDFREVVDLFQHKKDDKGVFHAKDGSASLSFDEMSWKVENYMISLGLDKDETNDVLNVPANRFYDIIDNTRLAVVNPGAVLTAGLSPYKYENLPPLKHNYELHTIKWHFEMAEKLKSQPDELLDEMDRLQDRFEDLLKVRASISDQLFVAFQSFMKCYVPKWEGKPEQAYEEKARLHLPDTGRPWDYYEDPARGITNPIDFNLFMGKDLNNRIDNSLLPTSILDKLVTIENIISNEKTIDVGSNVSISRIPIFNRATLGNLANFTRIGRIGEMSIPSAPATTTVMSYSSSSGYKIYAVQVPYWYFTNFTLVPMNHLAFSLLGKEAAVTLANKCYYNANSINQMAAKAKPVLDRLKIVDAALDNILARAVKEGCFSKSGRITTVTPLSQINIPKCDWSPRMFARVMRNGFAKIQAEDYRNCRNTSTSKFKPNKIGRFTIGTNYCGASAGGSLSGFDSCIDDKWTSNLTKSTTNFDNYIVSWKKAKEQITKDTQKARAMVFKHDKKGKVLGTRRSTNPSVGDSFFGGSASLYGEMYTRFDDNNNVKSNQIAMASGVKADVTILGESFPIADISYGIETQGTNKIHPTRTGFVLGDSNIWTDSLPADGTGTFSYVTNNGIETSKESPHAYFLIPILGFANIVIDGYGVASAELALNLNASVDESSRFKQNNTDEYSAVESAQSIISPQARVDAFVSAGLSIGIAEIGVKGSLNLLHVELPLAFNTNWDRNYYTLNGSLDLVLGTLSGRVSGYVELPWPAGDLEATLFSWNGIRSSNNLWNSNTQLAYMSVQNALLDIEAENEEDLENQD